MPSLLLEHLSHLPLSALLPGGVVLAWALWQLATPAHPLPRHRQAQRLGLWLVCLLLSLVLSHWREDAGTRSLHIPMVFALCVVVLSHPRWHAYWRWTACELVTGTYFALLVADLFGTLELVADGRMQAAGVLAGVGGAGWRDTLVLGPLVAASGYWAVRRAASRPARAAASMTASSL